MLLFAQQQFSKELIGGVLVKLPLDGRDNVEGGLLFRNMTQLIVCRLSME
jgi:hypothetical protein